MKFSFLTKIPDNFAQNWLNSVQLLTFFMKIRANIPDFQFETFMPMEAILTIIKRRISHDTFQDEFNGVHKFNKSTIDVFGMF